MSDDMYKTELPADDIDADTDIGADLDSDVDDDLDADIDDGPGQSDLIEDPRYMEPFGPGDKEAARWNTELAAIKAHAAEGDTERQFSEQTDKPGDQAQNSLDSDITPSEQVTDPHDNNTQLRPLTPDDINNLRNKERPEPVTPGELRDKFDPEIPPQLPYDKKHAG